jgi:hypothetical protein
VGEMGEMGENVGKCVKLWVNGCVGVGKRWEMWVCKARACGIKHGRRARMSSAEIVRRAADKAYALRDALAAVRRFWTYGRYANETRRVSAGVIVADLSSCREDDNEKCILYARR